MKKLQRLSVRTSKQNEDYLRQLMTDNKRSMSYLVDLMIDAFRTRGVTDERDVRGKFKRTKPSERGRRLIKGYKEDILKEDHSPYGPDLEFFKHNKDDIVKNEIKF